MKRKALKRKYRAEREQWREERFAFGRLIQKLKEEIGEAKREVEVFRHEAVEANRQNVELKRQHAQQVKANWNLYDKAQAEVTAQELALFQASPAYKKYQKYRAKRGSVS